MNGKINTVGIKTNNLEGMTGALSVGKTGTVNGFLIPKWELNSGTKEKRLQFPGVYFLIGKDKNGKISDIYIGKAGFRDSKNKEENKAILARLREHANSESEWYQDLWSYAVAFTCSDIKENNDGNIELISSWGLTEISNLEYIIYNSIPTKIKINSAKPQIGSKDNIENVDYIGILQSMQGVLTKLNLNFYDNSSNLDDISITETSLEDGLKVLETRRCPRNINKDSPIPEIETPREIVKQIVNLIPKELFNSKTRFLDIACKSGVFLEEIYNRLMDDDTLPNYPKKQEAKSNYILNMQLFGIALSDKSKSVSIKTFGGYMYNIKTIKNYKIKVKEENDIKSLDTGSLKKKQSNEHKHITDIIKDLFKTVTEDEQGKEIVNMKFDVVIGNPPYQENNNGGTGSGANSLYERFIIQAMKLNPDHIIMITKSSWFNGSGYKTFREQFLKGNHLRTIIDYTNSDEVFPEMDGIAGGVSYFHWDKNYSGDCYFENHTKGVVEASKEQFNNKSIIIRQSILRSVVNKVTKTRGCLPALEIVN